MTRRQYLYVNNRQDTMVDIMSMDFFGDAFLPYMMYVFMNPFMYDR